MKKLEKFLRVKNYKGHVVSVVREHYLRDDIPCKSDLCLACPRGHGTILTTELTHYVIPDCKAARNYLEIFEFQDISGVIILQTVVSYIQNSVGRRQYSKLKSLFNDCRQQSVLFYNEFCEGAFVQRHSGEPLDAWQARCVYSSVVWYYKHLDGQLPIIMISDDAKVINEYQGETAGVFVMNMEDYLQTFWSMYHQIHDLYDSLSLAINETKSVGKSFQRHGKKGFNTEYSEYLPKHVLQAGVKSGLYYQGNLQVNKYNPQEAFLQRSSDSDTCLGSSVKDNQIKDILISGRGCRNRSVQGDTVVVELLPRNQWKSKSNSLVNNEQVKSAASEEETSEADSRNVVPTGRVVGIMQRNWRDYVVSFSEDEKSQGQRTKAGKVLVVPWDHRIPKIRISTRQVDALRDHRIVVRVDSWEVDSMYPSGHFVCSLGPIGELESETAAILVETCLSAPPFTEAQIAELPSNDPDDPWIMSEQEVASRRDLRSTHLIFSIDPKGCEDVDDTLSVRILNNGHTELGVHIADVTHFVKPGTLTDLEAKARSTTVYLADRRYDMLPAVLSADLCSLIGGVDRYAVSVIWELDEDYEVVSVWYGRTVIKSAYKLFYEAAQALADGEISDVDMINDIPELQVIEDKNTVSDKLSELREAVSRLMHIARHLKAIRSSKGAVALEGVEVQVQITDKKDIQDLQLKKPLEVHETIAECMIFANHWVAKKISEAFPSCALLRHHPLPRQEYFSNLIKCANSKGFEIDTSSNRSLAESLDLCTDPDDPTFNMLLRSLATQAMSNALYFSTGSLPQDQFFHYGLALDRYTHFTSPIRRYADIIVHRLLMAAIAKDQNQRTSEFGNIGNKELNELSQHINTKHKAAQQAQKMSVELFQTLYFQQLSEDESCCVLEAVITDIRVNGLLIFVPRFGVKGGIFLKNKQGLVLSPEKHGSKLLFGEGSLSIDEFSATIQNNYGSFKFRLFDHIQVHVSVESSRTHAQSLHFDLLSFEIIQKQENNRLMSNSSNKSKAHRQQLIKDVKQTQDKQLILTTQKPDMGVDFAGLQQQYGQTHPCVSLYNLINDLKQISMTLE